MIIFAASNWRNVYYSDMVMILREAGYVVYDFW